MFGVWIKLNFLVIDWYNHSIWGCLLPRKFEVFVFPHSHQLIQLLSLCHFHRELNALNNILLNRGELANLSTDRLKQFLKFLPGPLLNYPHHRLRVVVDRHVSPESEHFQPFPTLSLLTYSKILICFAIHEVDTVVSHSLPGFTGLFKLANLVIVAWPSWSPKDTTSYHFGVSPGSGYLQRSIYQPNAR